MLFVLLVSVGGEGGGRKDGDIPEGICSSTLTSPVNLKFFFTRDTINNKTISIHGYWNSGAKADMLKRGSLSLQQSSLRIKNSVLSPQSVVGSDNHAREEQNTINVTKSHWAAGQTVGQWCHPVDGN